MTKEDNRIIQSLIAEREEVAYRRIKDDTYYQKICNRQKEDRKVVEELYNDRFTQEEQDTINDYHEGGNEKRSMEIDEVYIQGFKDCFKLIIHLGILADSVKM